MTIFKICKILQQGSSSVCFLNKFQWLAFHLRNKKGLSISFLYSDYNWVHFNYRLFDYVADNLGYRIVQVFIKCSIMSAFCFVQKPSNVIGIRSMTCIIFVMICILGESVQRWTNQPWFLSQDQRWRPQPWIWGCILLLLLILLLDPDPNIHHLY